MAAQVKYKIIRRLKTAWLQSGVAKKGIILFLHGYPDTPESWNFQIDFFESDYLVIAPYARGAMPSESSPHLSRFSLEACCLDQLEILREADPTRKVPIICVGHDLGGPVAWRLASLLGHQLKALIIINSLSIEQMRDRFRSSTKQKMRSWYMLPLMVPELSVGFLKRYPGVMLKIAHKTGALPPAKRPMLAENLPGVAHPVHHYRGLLRTMWKERSFRPLRIDKPVLIIWGKNDPFLEMIHTREMEKAASKFTIRVLEGSHWIHREHSEQINRIIEEFLCNS